MNTKITTFLSTLTLLLAVSASAQVIKIPGGPITPISYGGVAQILPGPISNLPPLYMPAPSINASVSLMVDPLYSKIILPITPIMPSRDGMPAPRVIPVTPNPGIMPIMPVQYGTLSALRTQLTAAPSKEAKADTAAARARIEKLFDGRKQAADAEPVRTSNHVSLPENDLEKEIGAY